MNREDRKKEKKRLTLKLRTERIHTSVIHTAHSGKGKEKRKQLVYAVRKLGKIGKK